MNERRAELLEQHRDLSLRMQAVEDELVSLKSVKRVSEVLHDHGLTGNLTYKAEVLLQYGFDADETEVLLRKLLAT